MLPTPDTGHLKESAFRDVYEPAEDTFLLLDALEQEFSTAIKPLRPRLSLEIGSGSGCVSAFLGTMLGSNTCCYLATDINEKAAQATHITANKNKVPLQPIRTKFYSGLHHRLLGKIDILLFNPPYVVTPSEEVGSHSIEAAWAGGIDGREVIDEFLPHVKLLLSPCGIFYMVVVDENKPLDIIEIMRRDHGLDGSTVMKRSAGREKLSILKFTRIAS